MTSLIRVVVANSKLKTERTGLRDGDVHHFENKLLLCILLRSLERVNDERNQASRYCGCDCIEIPSFAILLDTVATVAAELTAVP